MFETGFGKKTGSATIHNIQTVAEHIKHIKSKHTLILENEQVIKLITNEIIIKIEIEINVNKLPAGLEVGLQELVEDPHVDFLREEDMVGHILHDLAHQREAPLHPRGGLLLDDARLARGD